MGRTRVELRATASLSRHNSKQDALDNQTWNDFVADVKALAQDYTDTGLFIDVMGDGDQPIFGWSD